jgi:hypothetical protein
LFMFLVDYIHMSDSQKIVNRLWESVNIRQN